MRVLLATKKYMPAAGGAERSAHALLIAGMDQGHDVGAVVQSHKKYGGTTGSVVHVGPVPVRLVQNEEGLRSALWQPSRPDMVFTQIDWNKTAVQIARDEQVPVVHFSRVGDANFAADLQVFNSMYVRDRWLRTNPEIANHSVVLYPTIREQELGPAQPGGPAILAVNPVRAKGGLLLRAIAERMPDTPFVATRGWCHPLKDGVDFGGLSNVRLLAPTDGIGPLAAQCFALVMPAKWDEPFGRVIVEAMGAGLPVIASRRGGIPEAMGGAGMLLEPDAGADVWVRALRALQGFGDCYRREREAGLRRAARYRVESDPGPLFRRLELLQLNYSQPRHVSGLPAPDVNEEWFVNLDEGV